MPDDVGTNFDDLYKAIALLICKSPLTYKEFCKNLKTQTVHTAKEVMSNPQITDIANTTGIDRNVISEHLKSSIDYKSPSKLSLLLGDMWRHRDHENKLTWGKYLELSRGPLSSAISPTKALDELEAFNVIDVVRNGDKVIEITLISNQLVVSDDIKTGCEIGSLSILRHIHSIVYNLNNSDKLFQRDLRSSQVPISRQDKMHKEVKDKLNDEVWPMFQELIESHEADVPVGTYPDCGIAAFEFYSNKKV
tara:strand:- start:1840 stop:2589 length:750 start_codon:yes stop_codon:yes gene_type:complete